MPALCLCKIRASNNQTWMEKKLSRMVNLSAELFTADDPGSNWIQFWTHSWPHQALLDCSNSFITNQNKSYGSWKGIVLGQVKLIVVGGRWEKVDKEELLHRIIYMYEIVTAQLNKKWIIRSTCHINFYTSILKLSLRILLATYSREYYCNISLL